MKLIDLHVHSTASDGSCSPSEVVALAKDADLAAIALTDHDTVSGIDEALEASGPLDLIVVPGVELSCIYKEKEIHILGLYIDPASESLINFLTSTAKKRRERNEKMVEWAFYTLTRPESQENRGGYPAGQVAKVTDVFFYSTTIENQR